MWVVISFIVHLASKLSDLVGKIGQTASKTSNLARKNGQPASKTSIPARKNGRTASKTSIPTRKNGRTASRTSVNYSTVILANFSRRVFSPMTSKLTVMRALSGVPSMRMTEPSPKRSCAMREPTERVLPP